MRRLFKTSLFALYVLVYMLVSVYATALIVDYYLPDCPQKTELSISIVQLLFISTLFNPYVLYAFCASGMNINKS